MAKEIITSLCSLLYPALCNNCRKLLNSHSKIGLCEDCFEQLEFFDEDDSLVTLPSGTLGAAAGPYFGLLSELIKGFKFYQNLSVSKTLSACLSQQNCTRWLLKSSDLVIPVPISRRRRIERGFNQCDILLANLEKELALNIGFGVVSREHRTAQHTLARKERLENAKGAFYLAKPELVKDRIVTIFDDVMTTQATAEAMVAVIAAGQPKEVRVVTLARTV